MYIWNPKYKGTKTCIYPLPFFYMLHMQLTQVKIQMIHINSFILLKRIYYEIFLVVKSHCLSLVHALFTTVNQLHCTVYEVLRGLIKTKDRGFNTPLQPSNCRSISNMHSCIYFTNLRFYGMHIIIRRNRYNRTSSVSHVFGVYP